MQSAAVEYTLAKWLRNGGWWLAERTLTIVLAVVVQIVVVRVLGAAAYGEIAYSLAILGLLLPIAQAGANGLVGRALIDAPGDERAIIAAALQIRIFGSTIALLGGLLYWTFVEPDRDQAAMIALLVCQTALCFQVIEQKYQVVADGKPLAMARMLVISLAAAAKITAALVFGSPAAVLLVYAVESLTHGIAHAGVFSRDVGYWPRPSGRSSWRRWFVTRSPWLVVSGFAEAVYLKIDILMLERLSEPREIGLYALAARISEIWLIIPTILVATGFARLWEHRQPTALFDRELQRWLDLLVTLGLIVALTLTFLSSPLVTILFGNELADAAPVLAIHVWCGLFAAMRVLLSRWLMVQDYVGISLMTTMLGATTNVALNYWLIPSYGASGAAVATVVSYGVAGFLSLFLLSRTRSLAKQMAKALLIPLRWGDLRNHFATLRQRVATSSNER